MASEKKESRKKKIKKTPLIECGIGTVKLTAAMRMRFFKSLIGLPVQLKRDIVFVS